MKWYDDSKYIKTYDRWRHVMQQAAQNHQNVSEQKPFAIFSRHEGTLTVRWSRDTSIRLCKLCEGIEYEVKKGTTEKVSVIFYPTTLDVHLDLHDDKVSSFLEAVCKKYPTLRIPEDVKEHTKDLRFRTI